MIAAGAGIPMHFIAEPEGSTRTTAESAGGPTFRHYQQRQNYFIWMVEDLTKIALKRRSMVDRAIKADEVIKINASDISARDNASLAVAGSTIIGSFFNLRAQGLIDDAELLRISYKFCGEIIDVEEMLKRGKVAGPLSFPPSGAGVGAASPHPSGGKSPNPPAAAGGAGGNALKPSGIEIDPITGEIKGEDEA